MNETERLIRDPRYLRRTFGMECLMFALPKNTLIAGLAALALGGTIFAAGPAAAGASTGTWRNGMVAGPGGVGCYDPGCAARNYGYRRSYGYRPVQEDRGYGYGRRGYGRDCYVERQRSTNRWGDVVIRRVR